MYLEIRKGIGNVNSANHTYLEIRKGIGNVNSANHTLLEIRKGIGNVNSADHTYLEIRKGIGNEISADHTYLEIRKGIGNVNSADHTYLEIRKGIGNVNCADQEQQQHKYVANHSEAYKTCTDEPPHNKTNKVICAPSEDSDQPGHPPSLIRVFAVRMKKGWVLSYSLSAQQRF